MANSEIRSKTSRVLSLFKRFNRGEIIQKSIEAQRFHVEDKTIQRDIKDIRDYLVELQSDGELCEIIYLRDKKGYIMTNHGEMWLKGPDVLAITKVLLESRAFCKEEMDLFLSKLLLQVSAPEKKQIQEIIHNEKFHYTSVRNGKALVDILWRLSQSMQEQWLVKIHYKKENDEYPVIRVVEPQGIIFSEYYFYLIACIHNTHYDFPAIYRVDRIQEMIVIEEHYRVSYCKQFKEGEFRKRVQFMKSGQLLSIRFKFWGDSLDAVMDRLPTARVIEREGNVSLIEAEVFGEGIKMWLLSQAEYLEVVGPEKFRQEMKRTIGEMVKNYENQAERY